MGWLDNAIGSALLKQNQRDAQRATVQPLGQAIMQDDPILDDPAYLATNPVLAALLTQGVPQQQPSAPVAMLPASLASLVTDGFPQQAQANPLQEAVSQIPAATQTNNTAGIASQLQQAVTPADASAPAQSGGFMDFLNDPKIFELLLQTGLGLARGEEFGQALTGGVQGYVNLMPMHKLHKLPSGKQLAKINWLLPRLQSV